MGLSSVYDGDSIFSLSFDSGTKVKLSLSEIEEIIINFQDVYLHLDERNEPYEKKTEDANVEK